MHALRPLIRSAAWLLAGALLVGLPARALDPPAAPRGGATVAAVQVGEQPLTVPVPAGYVDARSVSAQIAQVGEAMTPSSNRLLAMWLSQGTAAEIKAGRRPGLGRYFMLQTLRAMEGRALSDAEFEQARQQVQQQLAKIVKDAQPQIDREVQRGVESLRKDEVAPDLKLKIGQVQTLGMLHNRPRAFAFLMRVPVSQGEGQPPLVMLSATLLTRVKGRLIYLMAYAADSGPEAREWVKTQTGAWADALERLP